MGKKSKSSSGGCGCLSLIFFCLLVWALVFGVTVGGRHYGISCTIDRGVVVE